MRTRRYVKEREGRKERPSDIVRLEGKTCLKSRLMSCGSFFPLCLQQACILSADICVAAHGSRRRINMLFVTNTQVLALWVTSGPKSVKSLTRKVLKHRKQTTEASDSQTTTRYFMPNKNRSSYCELSAHRSPDD